MEVLPLKAIREEDGPIIGNNLLNLAKLAQAGLPVADGIVVTPPNLKFKTILEHFQFKDREVFEQSLHLVKRKIAEIPVPLQLGSVLFKKEINPKKLWVNLMDGWFEQIRSKIWREGFSPKFTTVLTAEPVFFTNRVTASGEVYFNYGQHLAVVKTYSGRLIPEQVLELEALIEKANKKLLLPQIYQWIVNADAKNNGKLLIVKLSPFTGNPFQEGQDLYYRDINKNKPEDPVSTEKSSVKVFLEMGDDYKIARGIDGVFIKGEKVTDYDTKILQLVEAGITFPAAPIIFRLPDIKEGFGGVRGTLKLIHSDTILKKEAEIYLFCRHKKGLLNAAIGIPFTRSVQEFLQIKRDLAVLGISRKGSLKLWFEMAAPENILNLEDYLMAGFDGAIINLDELAAWLGGFNPEEPESIFYKKQVGAMVKFLEDGLKVLHKAGIPMLASGKLALHDDVLAFLINKGVWGINVDFSNIFGIHDHLRFVEKRNLRLKTA
ncbi:hypothetical protein HYW46_02755 [Candidatus Daviesbacteria bacterium]|nr:hypothetical protein [Candidatus Daviesbacteria bacterium]